MDMFLRGVKTRSAFSFIPRSFFLLLAGCGLAACGGGGSSPTASPGVASVAAKTSTIPAGDTTCAYGGILVETGIDENGNGVLDASEVDATEKVCNGADGSDGLNALINLTTEPVGVNCSNGGLRIDVGIDTNSNDDLDPAEITQTGFVCNSTDGSIGWQVATLLENQPGGADMPQVSMDSGGNAVAVWQQYDGGRLNIRANRYVVGIGWGSAELIETNNAGDAMGSQVSADGRGNAVAVWHQWDGTRYNIWTNRYAVGTGWGRAELIDTNAIGPQVSMDTSGNAVAVWYQHDGARYNIRASRYVVGSGWSRAELIETDNAGGAAEPQVSVDASGNAVAVWYQHDGTRTNIWANRYVVDSGWGRTELIETDNAGDAASPQVSVDASGNAVAVWTQHDGTRTNIWANRYVVGIGWGKAELIETDNAGDAMRPQVSMDASGNAVAVWSQDDGTRFNIRANRYVVGIGWGSGELIETDNAGNATRPQVSVDAGGNAVAVWEQADGTRLNIWANRYVVGIGWGSGELIETETGDAVLPQISMDANGNGVAVWQQNDGTRFNIWSNRREAP